MGGEYMKTEDLKEIGVRIAERRKELKLTQEQTAERMNVRKGAAPAAATRLHSKASDGQAFSIPRMFISI